MTAHGSAASSAPVGPGRRDPRRSRWRRRSAGPPAAAAAARHFSPVGKPGAAAAAEPGGGDGRDRPGGAEVADGLAEAVEGAGADGRVEVARVGGDRVGRARAGSRGQSLGVARNVGHQVARPP